MDQDKFYEIDKDTMIIFSDAFVYKYRLNEVIKTIKREKIKNVIIGEKVKKIPSNAFKNCHFIKRVELPDGLLAIGSRAFEGCSCLKQINIPETVKKIDEEAFIDCVSLEKIKLPDVLEEISNACFKNCYSLNEISLPKKLNSIKRCAFWDCRNLLEIIIPEGASIIEHHAFADCTSLRCVILPSSINKISEGAFRLTDIKSICLPEGVKIIEKHAFAYCNKLSEVILPSSLKKIGIAAFKDCDELRQIKLPEGLEVLDKCAFYDCWRLEKVEWPSTLKRIEECSFYGCSSLKEIVFNEGLEVIGINAFENCTGLKNVYFPNSLSTLNLGAFEHCDNLEKIKFNKNIKYIANNVFNNTPKFKSVLEINNEDKVIEDYRFVNNRCDCLCLYDYEEKKYKFYYNGEYHEFTAEQLFNNRVFNDDSLLLIEENFIHLSYWVEKNKFLPHEDIILNMPIEDIDMFYMNGNYKKWAELLNMVRPSNRTNKIALLKLCYVLGVFQKSTSERDKAVEYIKKHILKKGCDEEVIHFKFDGFDIKNGFDPMYAEFFMKYFSYDSYFMVDRITGNVLLAASYNDFKRVREMYPNKIVNTNRDTDVLLPEHVINALTNVKYEYIDEGNEPLALLVGRYGYTQEQFYSLQEWFNEGKKISTNKMKIFISPDIKGEDNKVSYKLLEKDNPLGAVLGNITNCCQIVGGAGESCVKYGMNMPNSKFMTFNIGDKIIGQSWIWYDERTKVICLDNIEVPTKVISVIKHDKNLQKDFIECLKRMAINFMNEMEKHGLEVESVTIGKGYNDVGDILADAFKVSKKSLLTEYRGYSDAKEQYIVYNKKR